ncbi:hypothetical protein ACI65C_004804 [Semiaphis heraclei]
MTSSSSEVQSSEIGAPIPRKRRRTYKNQEDDRICNSDKTEQIHQALAKMIALNQMPLSFCSSEGFKHEENNKFFPINYDEKKSKLFNSEENNQKSTKSSERKVPYATTSMQWQEIQKEKECVKLRKQEAIDTNVICHRFPNPRSDMERLKTWMKIVGLEYEDPYLVYTKKYICSLHFTNESNDLDTSAMSGIIELDTSQANSNAIIVESVQNNINDLVDLDTSAMSGIIELDTFQANSNAIIVESVQNNINDLVELDTSAMSGIIDASLADPHLIKINVEISKSPRATICPRPTKNREEFYEVIQENGERTKIVHLFDVPHLMKCTRNNLVTKNLSFEMDGINKLAKWQHLEELYQTDSALPDSKMLPRLSDYHVIPHKIPKMKVRHATQIFSQRVSAVMNFLASKSIIEPSAVDTAALFLFFDKLFDSLNSSFHKVVEGKIYQTAVTKNSIHHDLWTNSIKVIRTMKFIEKNGKVVNVPTLQNWITTIKVRSLGCDNPTSHAFISAYKTLLLNNLISSQSPGANCKDSLITYKNFFSCNQEQSLAVEVSVSIPFESRRELNDTTTKLMHDAHVYIAGFVAKKLNRELYKNCEECLKKICTNQVSKDNDLIVARDYQACTRLTLRYPTKPFHQMLHNIIVYIGEHLPSKCHSLGIREMITNGIQKKCDLTTLHCINHDETFKKKIVRSIVKLFIDHWCAEVNRILHGKRSLQLGENDPIKQLASIWYEKHKKKKIITGKFNQV